MKNWTCKICNVECTYNEPRMKKGMILNHEFYYSYRFVCPVCKRWYYPEEAKLYYKDVEKNIDLTVEKGLLQTLQEVAEKFYDKSSLKRGRQLIHSFHQYFLDNPNSFYNRQEKLDGLKYLAEVKITPKKNLEKRRNEYNDKKTDSAWKLHIDDEKCFLCFSKAQIHHHLIQLQNGGRNSHNNIRVLCRSCHAEVHPWLKTK